MSKLLLLVLLSLGILLIGCSPKQRTDPEIKQSQAPRLFSDFIPGKINTIIIFDRDSRIKLERTDAGWFLTEPYQHEADGVTVFNFLNHLYHLRKGVRLNLSPDQLKKLELVSPDKNSSSRSVQIDLEGEAQHHSLVIGIIDIPKNKEMDATFMGVNAVTRRYTHVKSENFTALVDDMILTEFPHAIDWIKKEFRALNRIKTIQVNIPAGKSWQAFRTGRLKSFDFSPSTAYSPVRNQLLNHFMSEGTYLDLIPPGDKKHLLQNTIAEVIISDFHDISYRLTIYPVKTLDYRSTQEKEASDEYARYQAEKQIIDAYPVKLSIESGDKTEIQHIYMIKAYMEFLLNPHPEQNHE